MPTTNYAIQIGRNNTRKHVLNTGFIIWFHYNNLISDLSYFRVLENSLKMFFSAVFYNLLTFSSYTNHGNLFKSINRKDEREKNGHVNLCTFGAWQWNLRWEGYTNTLVFVFFWGYIVRYLKHSVCILLSILIISEIHMQFIYNLLYINW